MQDRLQIVRNYGVAMDKVRQTYESLVATKAVSPENYLPHASNRISIQQLDLMIGINKRLINYLEQFNNYNNKHTIAALKKLLCEDITKPEENIHYFISRVMDFVQGHQGESLTISLIDDCFKNYMYWLMMMVSSLLLGAIFAIYAPAILSSLFAVTVAANGFVPVMGIVVGLFSAMVCAFQAVSYSLGFKLELRGGQFFKSDLRTPEKVWENADADIGWPSELCNNKGFRPRLQDCLHIYFFSDVENQKLRDEIGAEYQKLATP
ncbi:MAG: hypothetical protein NXI01_07685 [Gammaproteobacteria bacterium]|nr:hypothetical protein [Gammaproteobacteria bacterium]